MMPANSTGPRIAETQNHLVRTRSTNSRRMIAQTLCMRAPSPSIARRGRRGGLRTDEIHEDLVQGRVRQLEAGEPRTGRDEALEDLLRVRARSELELRLLTEILNLGDEAPVREDLLRVALAAIERHDHVLTAVGALHLRERAVDQFPAARNNA